MKITNFVDHPERSSKKPVFATTSSVYTKSLGGVVYLRIHRETDNKKAVMIMSIDEACRLYERLGHSIATVAEKAGYKPPVLPELESLDAEDIIKELEGKAGQSFMADEQARLYKE